MEIGGPFDEMVFGDFEDLSKVVEHLCQVIEKRKMMTGSENQKLKALKTKVRLYVDIEKDRRDSLKRRIDYLLTTYYSYYNG